MEASLETQRPVAFRFELRRATRAGHQMLDDHRAFTALAGGRLGFEAYRQLMALFHGLYAGLDDALDADCRRLLPSGGDYTYVHRTPLLARDLDDLGAVPVRAAEGPPPHGSLAGLCGALYVVEGSVLGGVMLQRATAALLAGRGGAGDAYWRWCRDAGGPRWAATCGLIEANAATPRSRGEMVDAAQATFALFSDWFGQWRDESATTRSCASPAPC